MQMYSIRRKRNSVKKGSIFPLVTQLGIDDCCSKFEIFHGTLVQNHVEVRDALGMKDIYNGGYFGTGNSSYAEPKFTSASHHAVMEKLHPEYKAQPEEETEVLILTACESFFLSFALGVLIVKPEDGNEMTIDQMYDHFYSMDQMFPFKYAAYHHFRSKGWVVRSGLNVGVDLVLYKDGPPFSHSSFMVLVRTDEKDTEYSMPAMEESQLDSLLRIAETVRKSVLVCYVIRSQPCSLEKLENLKTLKIIEVLKGHFDQKSTA